MTLTKARVVCEKQMGRGEPGEVYQGDVLDLLPALLKKYAGKAQLIYLDPPFMTGQKFFVRVRAGEKDWKTGTASMVETAYEDTLKKDEYLDMMRSVLTAAREMLSDTGVLFLHIDYRASAHLRLMMDEIFGEGNFLNEIIWTYQTGGRAKNYFSRKHDVILFYRKTRRYFFDIRGAAVERAGARKNHMKRHVDTDGRVYRSIRSGGKIYTYYDDEPVYPGDVWDDVSHLQQKDPQRTGYDTQKPIRLLERIVRCASRPGDLVIDLFAGSGTTLVAAQTLGRVFAGVDRGAQSMMIMRRRLEGANAAYYPAADKGDPVVEVSGRMGVGYYDLSLTAYELEKGVCARTFSGLDALDGWAVGYFRAGVFEVMAEERRSRACPALTGSLKLPVLTGEIMLRTLDVMGRQMYYICDREEMEI